jgi:predicted Zn-dependent protease
MPALQPPDSPHLQAAEGWIGLGNYAEANDELEQIAAANRAHPDVLQLRWRIYADARKWEACLHIATVLTTMTPECRFGWIHRAHALDKLGRTLEAKDLLLSIVNDFEANTTIPYHLAQYCARLGQIDHPSQLDDEGGAKAGKSCTCSPGEGGGLVHAETQKRQFAI